MDDTVRIAALGDIHVREGQVGIHHDLLADINANADILVLCGDVTDRGLPGEAESMAEALSRWSMPVVAVLGNHDMECGHEEEVVRILCQGGVTMLQDNPVEIKGVGFAGVKGFCGGFDECALTPFGEPMVKDFVRESIDEARRLDTGLAKLRTKHKIAVLHYAPIRDTVRGEPPEIFAFLGSSRLAEPLDRFHVTAAVHGHAHSGAHRGATPGGVPVYNVAHGVMQRVDPAHPWLRIELDDVSGDRRSSEVG